MVKTRHTGFRPRMRLEGDVVLDQAQGYERGERGGGRGGMVASPTSGRVSKTPHDRGLKVSHTSDVTTLRQARYPHPAP